jgi:alanine racemase
VTSEKRRIATVCIGYADGFDRAFSNRGYVLINGKKAPITGRVCMDMIMVDVTDIDDVIRLTVTSVTPFNFFTAFSTWETQAAHIIPVTANFRFIFCLSFI